MRKHEITIEHYNANGEVVDKEQMLLDDYMVLKKLALQHVIGDVERLIYSINGNLPRDQWGDDTIKLFASIRRQLLDCAGDISRIPDHLICPHEVPEDIDSFWKRVLGGKRV